MHVERVVGPLNAEANKTLPLTLKVSQGLVTGSYLNPTKDGPVEMRIVGRVRFQNLLELEAEPETPCDMTYSFKLKATDGTHTEFEGHLIGLGWSSQRPIHEIASLTKPGKMPTSPPPAVSRRRR